MKCENYGLRRVRTPVEIFSTRFECISRSFILRSFPPVSSVFFQARSQRERLVSSPTYVKKVTKPKAPIAEKIKKEEVKIQRKKSKKLIGLNPGKTTLVLSGEDV